MNKKGYVYFQDGSCYQGESFGAISQEPILTELVFNTSMTGYQEIFTDPSYCDQTVIMTYPLIGNYGINSDDLESITPTLKGVIISENSSLHSNYRAQSSLENFLFVNKIFAISDIDTRALTRKIRSLGAQKVLLSHKELSLAEIKMHLDQSLPTDQIKRVTTKSIQHFPTRGGKRIVMIDFGYKKNILESLIKRGCDVIVVPFDTSFERIKSFSPQGVLLSNGPGDPKSIEHIIPTIQKIQDTYPMFSICMGHQIFALANGADTHKMKFGHRGSNHPVIDLKTKKINMTSQNHSYCVSDESIMNTELEVTQINLNDKTIEGLKHKSRPCFSVQYHPEANPGPNDTNFLFDQFIETISEKNYAKL